jgi:hypothetical protein
VQFPRMFRRREVPRSDDKRPPLARLRSLLMEPGAERAHRIMGRILGELEESVDPGPWIAAARALAAEGLITEDAVCYLAEMFLQCITFQASRTDAEMLRLYAAIDEVKRAHGLRADEDWFVTDAPVEWQVLNAAWDERDRELRVSSLRASGNDELADLIARDQEAFDLRVASGHFDIWGAEEA